MDEDEEIEREAERDFDIPIQHQQVPFVKPWDKLGITPLEYVRLIESVERDIAKASWKASAEKYRHEPPGVFAGLGCVYWLLIIAMCLFFGYLFTL